MVRLVLGCTKRWMEMAPCLPAAIASIAKRGARDIIGSTKKTYDN